MESEIIHLEILGTVGLEVPDDLLDDAVASLGLLVRIVLLSKTDLAVTIESVLLEHLLTLCITFQARDIAELELRIGRKVMRRSPNHHISDEASSYQRVATVVDV